MAMQWIDEVRQTALIDEAEALAIRHLQAPYEPVLAKYQTIGFDMRAAATELQSLAAAARESRAKASTAQAMYEVESAQSRGKVEDAKKYLDQLRAVIRFARLRGHPLDTHLDRVFVDGFATESWSNTADFLSKALDRLDDPSGLASVHASGLAGFGLPPDFVERGRRLAVELRTERAEAELASTFRGFATQRLHEVLDRIVHLFEEIDAARDLVMALTGESLPGLELTLVRGAAASRSPRKPTEDESAEPGL